MFNPERAILINNTHLTPQIKEMVVTTKMKINLSRMLRKKLKRTNNQKKSYSRDKCSESKLMREYMMAIPVKKIMVSLQSLDQTFLHLKMITVPKQAQPLLPALIK